MPSVQFRIRLNGTNVPEVNVFPDYERPGRWKIRVMIENIGWFTVEPGDCLEYRDETAWLLLPIEMRRASADKCWCRAAHPQELIDILDSLEAYQ